MKFTRLYTGPDNHSYFEDKEAAIESIQALGNCSAKYPVQNLIFRDMKAGAYFDWHNAPHTQYIVYLEGETEVVASSGEKRRFKAGDILLADDLTGKGHTSRVMVEGKSLVIIVK